ncbi:MAG TPA: hypothetical protein VK886_21465 [Vicinamibacterales bacterium]|nr:hypothetical protein [Vicinamibacterales bacterium]
MSDDLVVLWHDRQAGCDLCFEIVQIGETEFELRVLHEGRVWLTEDAADFHELLDRARALHADLHPLAH